MLTQLCICEWWLHEISFCRIDSIAPSSSSIDFNVLARLLSSQQILGWGFVHWYGSVVVLSWLSIWRQPHSCLFVEFVLLVDLQEFLCCPELNRRHIWSFHRIFWPKSENCLYSRTQFEFQFNTWSAGNWSWLPIQVQFSYLQLNSSESNSIFEVILLKYGIGLKIVGKLVWQQEKGPNEDISIVLIIREQFSVSVLFKDILEAILLILHLQDNVIIQSNFFQYMYHVGCAFNLHSVINNGLIPGGQKTNSVFQH